MRNIPLLLRFVCLLIFVFITYLFDILKISKRRKKGFMHSEDGNWFLSHTTVAKNPNFSKKPALVVLFASSGLGEVHDDAMTENDVKVAVWKCTPGAFSPKMSFSTSPQMSFSTPLLQYLKCPSFRQSRRQSPTGTWTKRNVALPWRKMF